MADQTATLPDGAVVPLSTEERAASGFTHKATVKYSDINDSSWTTNGDTVSAEVLDTPVDWAILRTAINVTTAFATIGTLTVMFGTDGDPDNFIRETDATTAGPIVGAAGGVPETLAGSFAAASDQLQIRFTSESGTGGGAPADITAGELDVYFTLVPLNI